MAYTCARKTLIKWGRKRRRYQLMSQDNKLPLDELQRLQTLAGLQPEAHDAETLQVDLAAILHMVDQMHSTDTDSVEPLVHPLELHQRLRDDRSQTLDPKPLAIERQQNSQAVRQGFYLVPRVVG